MFLGDPSLAHCATTGTFFLASMPTADATLLPPPYSSSASTASTEARERGSVRRLDEVGVGTVLEAMIEQKHRRSSQPSFPAVSEIENTADEDDDESSSEERNERVPSRSEVFLKAR